MPTSMYVIVTPEMQLKAANIKLIGGPVELRIFCPTHWSQGLEWNSILKSAIKCYEAIIACCLHHFWMHHRDVEVLLSHVKAQVCLFIWPCERGGMIQPPHCPCKLQTSQESASLDSPIHQAKSNISVPGWGQTSHGTGSAISFGGWPLEGKVALLVTPQNAKTAIMAYGAAMSGIFELCCLGDWQHPKFIHRSWNKTAMRGFLRCENNTFFVWKYSKLHDHDLCLHTSRREQ